jgi:general secretion pathway protein A
VRHRLRVAGATGEIFTPGALRELHRLSSGIPRVINVSCDRALLGAYTREVRKVSAGLVRQAAGEVYGRRFVPVWLGWVTGVGLAASFAALSIIGFRTWQHQSAALRPSSPTSAAAGTSPRPAAPSSAVGSPAVGAATAKPMPPPVSMNGLLAANNANTSDAAAFRRLLSLWGTAMTDDRDPCGQAQRAGLACLEQRGSWAQVRTLNRPAILTLTDDAGQKHRVVLSALDDKFATLVLSEHNQRVAIEEVSRDWFGDFTIVWKPKTSRTRELSIGMHGDEVRWLRRSLAALHGASSDPEHGDLYDEELAIAVQNFQREHRLTVDGIAGLQTQVVLDTALAEPGSPLLLQTLPHS